MRKVLIKMPLLVIHTYKAKQNYFVIINLFFQELNEKEKIGK